MAFTQNLKYIWSQGNLSQSATVSQTGIAAPSLSVNVANGAADTLINFTCDNTTLQSLFILSTQALTLKTNSSTSPGNTFTLKANVPIVWHVDDDTANPLSAAITALYATNASGATASLYIQALHN